ncbi:hypothetical protein [Amycolatopsis nigrescens]|uniref:hypothetical protein n=1 Tax=Amycolatopsis nigrescens TaxID=381445 RepID=UPI00036383B0|nr:hypothetical protein [Amycolatopsis nigrescens]
MNDQDRLYHLVQEIEAGVAAVKQAVSTAEQAPAVHPIAGGLGTVVVDGKGTLISVDLDRKAASTHTGASLSRHVLRAIQEAEAAAKRRRVQMIDEAERKAHRHGR